MVLQVGGKRILCTSVMHKEKDQKKTYYKYREEI